jgi:two-component system chemotaxis response regulator CheY
MAPAEPDQANLIMGKRIVVIESSPKALAEISRALESAGHSVTGASELGDAILASGPGVDMVFVGSDSHGKAGLEATRRLRALPEHARTPVILITEDTSPAFRIEGRAAGATGWIVRPFTGEQLLSVVGRLDPALSGTAKSA